MSLSTVPFELVACKCDVTHFSGKSDPLTIEQAGQVLRGYTFHETSLEDSRTQKRCISSLLRSIETQTAGKVQIPCAFFLLAHYCRLPPTDIYKTHLPVLDFHSELQLSANPTLFPFLFFSLFSSPFFFVVLPLLLHLRRNRPYGSTTCTSLCAIFRGERPRRASARVHPCLSSAWILAHLATRDAKLLNLLLSHRPFNGQTFSVQSGLTTPLLDPARLHQSGDSRPPSSSSIETQSPHTLAAQDRRADSEATRTTSRIRGDTGLRDTSAPNREVDGTGTDRVPSDKTTGSTVAFNAPSSRYGRSNSHPVPPKTPPSGARLNTRRPSSPGLTTRQHALRTTWRHSAGSDGFNTFLDMEEETEDHSRSRPASSEQVPDRPHEIISNDPGVTFDDLVDRLVAIPMSKQDVKFAAIFLCLYRKFAAPAKLLNALINRFDQTERSAAPQLSRASDQLRLLNVLAQWVSDYPGDFAYPKTRTKLVDFVTALERNYVYMFAAKEISMHLEIIVDDDDVGWPFRDGDAEEPEGNETFLHTSARSSPTTTLLSQFSFSDHILHNVSSLDLSEDPSDLTSRDSGTLSHSSSAGRSTSTLTQSSTLVGTFESAQREALSLELTPKYLLTKVQWRQFMELPDDDFARELTRMDWIMYSSFRPRDLVRHVSISGQEKDKIKSLENVNRMIKEFNHLAFFVANMILLRDKPKHRARALEKFMNIAQVSGTVSRTFPPLQRSDIVYFRDSADKIITTPLGRSLPASTVHLSSASLRPESWSHLPCRRSS
jgi:hypothetical protein